MSLSHHKKTMRGRNQRRQEKNLYNSMFPHTLSGTRFPLKQPMRSFKMMYFNFFTPNDDICPIDYESYDLYAYKRFLDDRCTFVVGKGTGYAGADSSMSLWMIITDKDEKENIYFQYSIENPRHLKSVYVPYTCWEGDHERYDFDKDGNVVYYVDSNHSGHRRAYAFVKDGIFTEADSRSAEKLIGQKCSTLDDIMTDYDVRDAVAGY